MVYFSFGSFVIAIETLQNQITYAIEQITMQGINLKSYGISRSSMMDEKNDLSSHDGLLREYKRLGIQLKQLQILEKRTADQLKEIRLEEVTVTEEILKFTNLNVSNKGKMMYMVILVSINCKYFIRRYVKKLLLKWKN